MAPGGEEQGGSPRQQINWVKNPWAAPEGGRQREQRAVILSSSFLLRELEAVGGVGSQVAPQTLVQADGPGASLLEMIKFSSHRNQRDGGQIARRTVKQPKAGEGFCGILFPKCGKACRQSWMWFTLIIPSCRGMVPSTAWKTEGRYVLPVTPALERK